LKFTLNAFKDGLIGFARAHQMKTRIFSGAPLILRVSLSQRGDMPTWSLVFNNGLLLTLGEAGILDYQDKSFAQFMRGRGASSEHDHESLVTLHKIVLKSLLKYLVHPGLEAGQRERAAEAASKLWLAADNGFEPAGPARARASTAFN
jgi:hypothetical protein